MSGLRIGDRVEDDGGITKRCEGSVRALPRVIPRARVEVLLAEVEWRQAELRAQLTPSYQILNDATTGGLHELAYVAVALRAMLEATDGE